MLIKIGNRYLNLAMMTDAEIVHPDSDAPEVTLFFASPDAWSGVGHQAHATRRDCCRSVTFARDRAEVEALIAILDRACQYWHPGPYKDHDDETESDPSTHAG